VEYLSQYEQRYQLPVQRPVRVQAVRGNGGRLRVETDSGVWAARAVVSATGTWWRPFLPAVPGQTIFSGRQLHTVNYRRPADFTGQRVVVVGGGNSGAQIAADLATQPGIDLTWVTQRPPRFLADDIDGRALFDAATARRRALDAGTSDTGGVASLGDIVAVASVREARDAGLLKVAPMFSRLTAGGVEWADGSRAGADAVIWCTGFRPVLSHLAPLGLRGARGRIPTSGRVPWMSPACTCSATATGPARPQRPSSALAAPLAKRRARLACSWPTGRRNLGIEALGQRSLSVRVSCARWKSKCWVG
jgi:putative flavoprotein involved in K+ transport